MKALLKNVINGPLRAFGLEVRRVDTPRLFPRLYSDVIAELIGAFEQIGFSTFAPDDRRIPLMTELMGSKVAQSIYLIEHLRKTFALQGDVCEFGVAAGATSALIANEMRATDKKLWLFDSFQGLPKPSEKDRLIDDVFNLGSMERYEAAMSFPMDCVQQRLKDIGFPESRTEIVPGFIEQTLQEERQPSRVCFAYVDLDFYEPIRLALDFLHPITAPDGFVMIDDYGFLSEGARTAVDEFCGVHERDWERIVPYPFAGHFIILRRVG